MDRRTRTSLAASLALALAGCSPTALPSQPATSLPTASATATVGPPSAAPSPTQITVLPFGGTLVFKRNPVDGPHLLYTMPAAGGDATQLLGDGDAEQARWSADGTRLSVVVVDPTGSRIFLGFVDRDGSNLTRLWSRDATLNLGCGAWSRDEATFACEGWDEEKPRRNGLYTVAADGSGLARVTNPPGGGQDAPCDFSPDGQRIAFVRINLADENKSELMIIDRDGSGEHRLIDDAVMLRCRWSPDGSTILAATTAGILAVAMTDAGTTAALLPIDVPAGARLAYPAWSVDGEHVAFSAALPGRQYDIWVANADGSGATQVTDTPGIDDLVESWGP